MTPEKFKRKLTAILSADVKGYSRLMGTDEEGTLRTLQEYKELMASSIQHHRGRIVGGAGDSVLAEFASVVDAVQCAVEIQQVLRAKNALLPEDRRMDFRIGINLGDVIEEGDTIYGDGVNIAARLESIAEAGGICISESAYQQIENKLPLRYDYMGEHEVKNIAKPVRVYCARIEADAAPSKLAKEKKPVGIRLSKAALTIVAVVVIAGAVILYQFVLRPSPPKTEVASKDKMAYPLPDVPSIAVLPFVNMSGDSKQEFLSDGMTEAIITALSKVPRLFVIARNSTFVYKGKPTKVKQVSEELGVRYVLEGSLQTSGDHIRVTVQLIDAITGDHLWAERYDRDLKDIFAMQDEITIKVLTATRVKLTEGEQAETYRKYFSGKQGLDCYLKILEGSKYLSRASIEDHNVARRIAEETIAMCPENPFGYLNLAGFHRLDYYFGTSKSPQESVNKAIELAQKALSIDDSLPRAHAMLSDLYSAKREHDKAITEGERAVTLDPNGAYAHEFYALSLVYAGRPEEAIPFFQKANRLNPFSPTGFFLHYGHAFLSAGRLEEAVSTYRKSAQLSPNNIFAHIRLAATYSMMGREKEARAEAEEVLRLNPKFSVDTWAKRQNYKDQTVTDKIADALRKAGLK
jgi:adenylate cyclase